MTKSTTLSRRNLLKWAAGTTATAIITPSAFANSQVLDIPLPDAKSIKLVNIHTGEKVSVTYWEGGRYHFDALAELNSLLRDHRKDEVTEMDIALIDSVHQVSELLDTNQWINVISAYRSPMTNAEMQASGRGVATRSMHTYGKAIDIRIPGISTHQLHKAALKTRCGGVGKYVQDGFVHMDTGRLRTWYA
jgi:uncharacterized protein YcbK (DUF882 family)